MNRKERRASGHNIKNPNDYCRFVGVPGDLRMKVIHHIAVTSILWGFPPDGYDAYAAVWRDVEGHILHCISWEGGRLTNEAYADDENPTPEMTRFLERMEQFKTGSYYLSPNQKTKTLMSTGTKTIN